ncbi:ABC transporter ATP-binding protein [Corallincola spongiicola]|uniref:ATP-binding cassette domain-containing protein n=1 Tax=Corallincola spongiicola TaxID=2520508 RepID=A0ABY1WPN1_9GAMM|nr:ATP-binding cassette domain-containing protein [Corallincola spongiicola]TAA46039.1 ATP-binding cassette domain-containing protein [Corallincola spongiicola]
MKQKHIEIRDLTMAYGDRVIQQDLNFTIDGGDIFIIMGGSGCGKSTLMKHMIGLLTPAKGEVLFNDQAMWSCNEQQRQAMTQKFGVTYQSGALISSMTLEENIALPLETYTNLTHKDIRDLISLKLTLVGLEGYEKYYPSEISGGMAKRAALARAIALDPEVLFFDEPSAGLDPISARLLDDLILQLRDSLGATVVMVTHELASIFAIGTNSVFLDPETKTMIAQGDPNELLANCDDHRVQMFLRRGDLKESN